MPIKLEYNPNLRHFFMGKMTFSMGWTCLETRVELPDFNQEIAMSVRGNSLKGKAKAKHRSEGWVSLGYSPSIF